MSKKTKTLLFLLSISFFLFLSYFVVLYAYGYKLDFRKFEWVETGTFLVKANTDGAKVYLNGRYLSKTSFISNVLVKKNLLPDRYSLRIEKENHYALAKEFEIKSGQVSQLVHLYLPREQEIKEFISTREQLSRENEELVYFIAKGDGLLYRKPADSERETEEEPLSSEPVLIKAFKIKALNGDIYLVSSDARAPGVFLLTNEKWQSIYSRPANDVVFSPDKKKLAVVGQNEITVVWQKEDDEPPYFKKGHQELVLRIGQKISDVFWFKTNWHLIYLTDSGETNFIEIDPTAGRNDLVI